MIWPRTSKVLIINVDYTHRIGRTGRAGKAGCAVTFLSPTDTEVMYDLRILLEKSTLSSVPPELAKHEASRRKPEPEMKLKRKADETLYLI